MIALPFIPTAAVITPEVVEVIRRAFAGAVGQSLNDTRMELAVDFRERRCDLVYDVATTKDVRGSFGSYTLFGRTRLYIEGGLDPIVREAVLSTNEGKVMRARL